ncbi:septum formation protein [Alteromonadaceae bacterium Bs31]|nr:septum formation protein [Alteromonadaceae bacterium Bs31]
MTKNLTSSQTRIILASSSRYRRIQLQQLQLNFEAVSPSIDETPLMSEPAATLASRLAANKGLTVSRSSDTPAVIIASDQTASLGDTLLGKPGNEPRAIEQLQACSGHTVVFHTALWVSNGIEPALTDTVDTIVKFRKLSKQQVTSYIKKEQPLDCAGSFKCEGLGISLFESIQSEDPSALIGLPLIRLTSFLNHFGIHVI